MPSGATGHFLLPSGTPVQLPAHPPQQHAPAGPLAVLLIGPAGAGKTELIGPINAELQARQQQAAQVRTELLG
ncbi:hypothetical protein ABZ885_32150, partial [Kitasatospora sp. NPDC047058]